MKNVLGRAVTFVRDTVSGRRRMARFDHPEAHRGAAGVDRDQRLLSNHTGTGTAYPLW